jgi:formate dehydrogenase (coenzyme F420) beta subunit
MTNCVKLPVESGRINTALKGFFSDLLEHDLAHAVFLPMRQPDGVMVMHTLVRDPGRLEGLDPLAPVTPTSTARLLSSLTFKKPGFRIAAFLRPCDCRAYVELVKLKQAHREQVLLITTDCEGRLEPGGFLELASEAGEDTATAFHGRMLKGDTLPLVHACRVCEHPVHEGADIGLRVFGSDLENELVLCGQTETGADAINALGLEKAAEPEDRKKILADTIARRTAERDAMMKEYGERTSSFAALRDVLKTCINCYNCRAACPVCYCRECVFLTDTFRHDPDQFFRWAGKRGRVKLPTDTAFFHITRMLHISTLCVGCGQCSTACPMDLPVMELFRTAANRTQARFNYEPGRSPDEPLPLSVFEDQEFLDLTAE